MTTTLSSNRIFARSIADRIKTDTMSIRCLLSSIFDWSGGVCTGNLADDHGVALVKSIFIHLLRSIFSKALTVSIIIPIYFDGDTKCCVSQLEIFGLS